MKSAAHVMGAILEVPRKSSNDCREFPLFSQDGGPKYSSFRNEMEQKKERKDKIIYGKLQAKRAFSAGTLLSVALRKSLQVVVQWQ